MEILVYQEEWHGVPLGGILAESQNENEKVVGTGFYEKFYKEAIDKERAKINPYWINLKNETSKWVENTYLKPMKNIIGDNLKILSLGVGIGALEEPWIQKGYNVDLQECQELSMSALIKKYPHIKTYIGDARKINCPNETYDIIIMSSFDYLFTKSQYGELLKEVYRLLKSKGKAICICFSNISVRSIVVHIYKQLYSFLFKINSKNVVPWGWARTINEHIEIGKTQRLKTENNIYIFDLNFRFLSIKRPNWLCKFPTLHPSYVAVVWEK